FAIRAEGHGPDPPLVLHDCADRLAGLRRPKTRRPAADAADRETFSIRAEGKRPRARRILKGQFVFPWRLDGPQHGSVSTWMNENAGTVRTESERFESLQMLHGRTHRLARFNRPQLRSPTPVARFSEDGFSVRTEGCEFDVIQTQDRLSQRFMRFH